MKCQDGTGYRCRNDADVFLVFEGKRIPGPGMCWEHARAVLVEYKRKLGMGWAAESVKPKLEGP